MPLNQPPVKKNSEQNSDKQGTKPTFSVTNNTNFFRQTPPARPPRAALVPSKSSSPVLQSSSPTSQNRTRAVTTLNNPSEIKRIPVGLAPEVLAKQEESLIGLINEISGLVAKFPPSTENSDMSEIKAAALEIKLAIDSFTQSKKIKKEVSLEVKKLHENLNSAYKKTKEEIEGVMKLEQQRLGADKTFEEALKIELEIESLRNTVAEQRKIVQENSKSVSSENSVLPENITKKQVKSTVTNDKEKPNSPVGLPNKSSTSVSKLIQLFEKFGQEIDAQKTTILSGKRTSQNIDREKPLEAAKTLSTGSSSVEFPLTPWAPAELTRSAQAIKLIVEKIGSGNVSDKEIKSVLDDIKSFLKTLSAHSNKLKFEVQAKAKILSALKEAVDPILAEQRKIQQGIAEIQGDREAILEYANHARERHQKALQDKVELEARLVQLKQQQAEILIGHISSNAVDKLKTCLQAGFDPNARNAQGRTALHYAVELNKLDIVEILLQHKTEQYRTNPNIADNDGFLPLHLACKNKDIDTKIISILIKDPHHGGTRVQDKEGKVALDYLDPNRPRYVELKSELEEAKKQAGKTLRQIQNDVVHSLLSDSRFIINSIKADKKAFFETGSSDEIFSKIFGEYNRIRIEESKNFEGHRKVSKSAIKIDKEIQSRLKQDSEVTTLQNQQLIQSKKKTTINDLEKQGSTKLLPKEKAILSDLINFCYDELSSIFEANKNSQQFTISPCRAINEIRLIADGLTYSMKAKSQETRDKLLESVRIIFLDEFIHRSVEGNKTLRRAIQLRKESIQPLLSMEKIEDVPSNAFFSPRAEALLSEIKEIPDDAFISSEAKKLLVQLVENCFKNIADIFSARNVHQHQRSTEKLSHRDRSFSESRIKKPVQPTTLPESKPLATSPQLGSHIEKQVENRPNSQGLVSIMTLGCLTDVKSQEGKMQTQGKLSVLDPRQLSKHTLGC